MVHVKFKKPGEKLGTEVVNVDFAKLQDVWARTPRGVHLATDKRIADRAKKGLPAFEEQLLKDEVVVDAVHASIAENHVSLEDSPIAQIFNLMSAVHAGRIKPADIGNVQVRVPTDQVALFKRDFAPTHG